MFAPAIPGLNDHELDSVLAAARAAGAQTAGYVLLRLPIEVKDSTGHAQANPISVVRNGADTIDGLTTYPIASDFDAKTFKPETGGYAVI